jgi:hypothetical protein
MPTNSRVLKPISDYVANTEMEVAGVNADALDAAEARSLIMKAAAKAYNAKKKKKAAEATAQAVKTTAASGRLFPTLADDLANQYPLRRTPAIQSASRASNLANAAKFMGKVGSKAPPVQAFINAYEAMSLATDPEARKKADEQSKIMAARDRLHYADISKNAAQGFLDPMGTIYTAGKGIMSESFRVGLKEQIKEMIFGSR